jgi:hypothetical protein
MLLIPKAVFIRFEVHLNNRAIAAAVHAEYKKWPRYYLDFGGLSDVLVYLCNSEQV